MANHKSAAKRARQDEKKGARNSQTKSSIRSFEKKFRVCLSEKNVESAQELLKTYSSKIGKAVSKGIYHANHAARKISRLSSQLHKITK